jgi:large conductance mechanosensitive channel
MHGLDGTRIGHLRARVRESVRLPSEEERMPTPEHGMKIAGEFKEFLSRGSVVDLAVGIIIGAAFTTVVQSFVNDILNAFIGAVVGKPNFNDLTIGIGHGVIAYGRFLTSVLNFMIVAFALFLVIKAVNVVRRREEPAPALTEKDVLVEIRDLLRRAVSQN